jgi:hypothetical protein
MAVFCEGANCAYGRGNRARRALLTNMPSEACAAYREGVLERLLLTLSEFDPVAFPRAWVKGRPPSSGGCRRVVSEIFREMCVCVREEGCCAAMLPVAWKLHAWGRAIVAMRLGLRHRAFRFVLDAQLKEMVGIDSVYHTLHWQIVQVSQGSGRGAWTPSSLRDFALHTGSVYAMLDAVSGASCSLLAEHPRVKAYLLLVTAALEPIIAQHERRRLAVAMALHGRLGASSGLACLGGDLLPLCVVVPRARRCGEVLARWLA